MKLETQWTTFETLPIGKEFWKEGFRFIKKSTRTAYLMPSWPGNDVIYWFRRKDKVTADLPAD